MGWAAPWAFALLALVPLVLLLHSLRLRRREVRISAVYLWEELLRERRSTFGMSKLLRSLLLLLQILGIAALTLGLADPFARLPSTKEGDIVLAELAFRSAVNFEDAERRTVTLQDDVDRSANSVGLEEIRCPEPFLMLQVVGDDGLACTEGKT